MKIIERKKAPPGSYEGKFKEFMNKQGNYVFQTQQGPTIRYIVLSNDGVEVPGSFPLDFSHYKLINALGALGTPASALAPLFDTMGTNQFFRKLESKIKEIGVILHVWVAPDSSWLSVITPMSGTFVVKFIGIGSKDEDGNPVALPGRRTSFNEKYYDPNVKFFSALLRVVSGNHEGLTLKKSNIRYAIDYDDSMSEWVIHNNGKKSEEFCNFFSYHGIQLADISPARDFDDPKNGLPELERKLIKADTSLAIEVKEGWVDAMQAAPTSVSVSFDDFSDDKPKKKPRKRLVKSDTAVEVFLQVLQKELKLKNPLDMANKIHVQRFRRYAIKNKIPRKTPQTYSVSEIVDALNSIGYGSVADSLTPATQPKSNGKKRRKLRVRK